MPDDTTKILRAPLQADVMTMAVRMILTRKVSRAQLAKDFGVGMPTLFRWVRDAFDRSPYGDVLETLHEEVGILRKENAALKKMLLARNARAAPGTTGATDLDRRSGRGPLEVDVLARVAPNGDSSVPHD